MSYTARVRQQHRFELGARDARELAEVAVQVGLVVVAAVRGDRGEAEPAQPPSRDGSAVKPAPSRRAARPNRSTLASVFGGSPNCSAKRAAEVPPATAKLLGQLADAQRALGLAAPAPGPTHARR